MGTRYRGTGTVIKETLAAWLIKSHAGCDCNEICAEMDQYSADEVEQKFEYFFEKMKNSIQNWRKSNWIPVPQPPDSVIKSLLEYGIKTSRQEELEFHRSIQQQ